MRKYDLKNNRKVEGTAANEMLNEVEKLLIDKENSVCLESASMLNEIILSHEDSKIQRLCLNFILTSIKTFISTCKVE